MQLKLKKILQTKKDRVKIILKMWNEEVKSFFMAKMANKSSKYSKRFKKLCISIAGLSDEVKEGLITKYLEMRAHINAALFFTHYSKKHPEFDCTEQCDKRKKLSIIIERDLFDKVNTSGLDDPPSKNKIEENTNYASPKLTKKGSTLGFGAEKYKGIKSLKKARSQAPPPKLEKQVSSLQRALTGMSKNNSIPQYEYKPDKLTLRTLIVGAVKKEK
mmetsp:Transcript_22169/g.19701  ORF Transcript_22169/g.19701 Transcript_22169/m.19701 type:complete len:217 (+) Transcript_22169:501-1151(+)